LITADGNIVADATSACRLTGKLGSGVLPGTLKLELSTAGCGELPASSTGTEHGPRLGACPLPVGCR
jgi:hypothetical protein